MNQPITTTHPYLILDACCIMNLYASNYITDIIASIAESIAVAAYVKDIEALTVYKHSKKHAMEKEPINLNPLIDRKLLTVVNLDTEAEKLSFANLATQRLDDGEAITLSIAIHRNWAIATDDKLAIRLCNNQFPHIQCLSTPELLKHWVETAKPKPNSIKNALHNIENRANYLLGRQHPFYTWWETKK